MKLAGDILILILILLSNGRVLVLHKPHRDPIVMLSPLSFLLASLSLFAFSVDIFSILILFISFLTLLSNFHALIRYGSRLVVDRYSPLMKTWGILTTLLSGVTLAVLIVFAPTDVTKSRNSTVTENKLYYSGSFASGFSKTERFSRANVFFTEYSSKESEENENSQSDIILFMPDKRGDTISYEPFLFELASKGYRICSADFYCRDMKWVHSLEDSRMLRKFGLTIRSLINSEKYKSQREFYTFNYTKELENILTLLQKEYGPDQKYIVVTDDMAYTAANDVFQLHNDLITGVFDISTVPEYHTKGYGFVELTDPLLASFLGCKKEDPYTPVKACTDKTTEFINTGR